MYYYIIAGKMDECPSNQLGVLSIVEPQYVSFDDVDDETNIIYNWIYKNTDVSAHLKLRKMEQLPKGLSFFFKDAEVSRSMTIMESNTQTPTTYYLFRVKKR